MATTETDAHRTFTEARERLEKALANYVASRKRLHSTTGEFVGTDTNTTPQFATAEGRQGKAELRLTDC